MTVKFLGRKSVFFGLICLVLIIVVVILVYFRTGNQESSLSQKGEDIVLKYCQQSHDKFPEGCLITKVFQCDDRYILRNDCYGTGDIILNKLGEFVDWCGYTSLGEIGVDCQPYWFDSQGSDCTQTNNLCDK